MPTFPEGGSARPGGARPFRPVPVPAQNVALLALIKRFASWQVESPHGEFWLATRQRGNEQRIIAAQTVIALYGTLQRIEADEAPQAAPGGIYPDAVAGYLAYLDDLGCVRTGQRCPPGTAD